MESAGTACAVVDQFAEPNVHGSNPFQECGPEHRSFPSFSKDSLNGETLPPSSEEDFSCPIVIEVFCGTARVTAALKNIGLSGSFGVDHVTGKAISAVKLLDLTTLEGQRLLLRWLRSPRVQALFIAPPCGACSLARTIQLRDSKGRRIPGPVPLRSQEWPEGLPGLAPKLRLRVSLVNKLYAFVNTLIHVADSLRKIVVIENPRSSLFWSTVFWRKRAVKMFFAAHQACAYGADRPKWTVIASNSPVFRQICKTCPGESKFHVHKPWGLVQSMHGAHFATSEETAYPFELARALAECFAAIFVSKGWKPPPAIFSDERQADLAKMRAVAGSQPKASKLPPIVPEHKHIIVIAGPHETLATVPVFPMQRLSDAWLVPMGVSSPVRSIPKDAQLLRTTPLRSKGGQEVATGNNTEPCSVFQQAWGVPFTAEEFITEAAKAGHPKAFQNFAPTVLDEAVKSNFSANAVFDIMSRRAKWFKKWLSRASDLKSQEQALKMNMVEHQREILKPKRILLWKEMLKEANYSDPGVVDEMIAGVSLTGDIPPTGIFDPCFKPAEMSVQKLRERSSSDRLAAFYSARSSGDAEIDRIVFDKTQLEVEQGWARGPIALAELPDNAVVSRRFGLRQSSKVRLVDDMSGSSVNATVQATESPKPHGVDFIAALALAMVKQSFGQQVLGRTFDMKSAYKQMAVSPSDLWAAFVAIYNPVSRKPEIYHLLAPPFGATRSVYSFLRVAHSIWYLGVSQLAIMWSCFFDDFVTFAPAVLAANTQKTVETFFHLIGWRFAEDGSKAEDFSDVVSALGICVNLSRVASGCVEFSNNDKRTNELVETIKALLTKGFMSVVEAQKLRGRMQFCDGQLFGRIGKLCMRAVTDHAFVKGAGKIDEHCKEAMSRFARCLKTSPPRQIKITTGASWFVYTDACIEPNLDRAKCGLGGVTFHFFCQRHKSLSWEAP